MNFNEAMNFINSFSHTGGKITDLSRIKKLLDKIGNPQDSLKFVHIAGTNGKGSVLEYCSRALIDAGYKTGQFTSPFMECYCDRIRINCKNIPEEILAEICEGIKDKVKGDYSQFEITLAMALIYYKREKCDIVCFETGIGGSLDATNVIKSPLVSVITSVSLDHTQILGDTVEEIAMQKAGIIKENSSVVLSAGNEISVCEIIKEKAENCKSELIIPNKKEIKILSENILETEFLYKNKKYCIKIPGNHQVINAVTAIEVINLLNKKGFKINDKNLLTSFSETKINSRTEILNYDPLVIIDGGHNAAGINSLMDVLQLLGDKKIIGVVGMVKGKDCAYAADRLSEILDYAFCVDGFIDNAVPAENLAELFNCRSEFCDCETGIIKAKEMAKKENAALLICGSLYLSSALRNKCI